MLHRFEIANFYSIRDPQVIDLRAASNAPAEPGRLAPVWQGASESVPKVVTLFGPNASGKSNVLKALAFLAWFVGDSFQHALDEPLPYARFNDDEAQGLPTRLAVYFAGPADPARHTEPEARRCRYAYELVLGNPNGGLSSVLRETLRHWPSDGGRGVRLFERGESGEVMAGKAFELSGYYQAIKKILRPNASLISTLAQLDHEFSLLMRHAATSVISNVLVEKMEINESLLARYYAEHPEYLELLNIDIARFDLGIRGMRIQHTPDGPVTLFEHEGLRTLLPIQYESHGTRQFIRVFPLIVRALQTGGVAAIDELDLAIHPLILPEIVRWFHDPDRNRHAAQLWMTCHNASLLETLTKEEVLFCDKDERGRTTIYGLRDVRAVRRGDNYYRKYLSGVYGAVPHFG